jgi:hypothetical protein
MSQSLDIVRRLLIMNCWLAADADKKLFFFGICAALNRFYLTILILKSTCLPL